MRNALERRLVFSFSNNQLPVFQPITIGPALLSLALQTQSFLRSPPPVPQLSNASRGPAVIPPWAVDQLVERPLDALINNVRNLDKFIDLESADAKRAGTDKDSRALFALFNGLTALKTLAEFAAQESTVGASLPRLDAKFAQGLSEVQQFLEGFESEVLQLFFGEKRDDVVSTAKIDDGTTDYKGQRIALVPPDVDNDEVAERTDAIDGIVGDEIFEIDITKKDIDGVLQTDTIRVDLSKITGVINVDAVVDLINQEIAAVKLGGGSSKFLSRFSVAASGSTNLSIQLDDILTESVSLRSITGSSSVIAGRTASTAGVSGSTRSVLETYADITVDGAESGGAVGLSARIPDSSSLAMTEVSAVAVDSEGFTYAVGTTTGGFKGQIGTATSEDVFLHKVDSQGKIIFSRLLGSATSSDAFAITIDANDNVIIAGSTKDDLTGTGIFRGTDAFITKFAGNGDELFTTQLDTVASDAALALVTDANGDVYVAGVTSGPISSTSGFSGGTDATLFKLDGTSGALLASTTIGDGGRERAVGLALAADGNLLIAIEDDGAAVLKKIDVTDLTNEIASQNLGDLGGGALVGLAVDGTNIFLTGSTTSTSFGVGTLVAGTTASGETDIFVTRIDDLGSSFSAQFTSIVGTVSTDRVRGIAASGGEVYVAGDTAGAFSGEELTGDRDAFIAKIDATTGALIFAEQVGVKDKDLTYTGVAISATGDSVLDKLGLRSGSLQHKPTEDIVSQTSVRPGDHFFVSVNGGTAKKVVIEAGDDFADLARKLRLVSPSFVDAREKFSTSGNLLTIRANEGAEIELIPGRDGRDALTRLGIEPGRLLAFELLFNLGNIDDGVDESDRGGAFGLELDLQFNLKTKTAAKFALTTLEAALKTIPRAHRSLDLSILRALLANAKPEIGPPPAFMAARLQNFQVALFNLQSASLFQSQGFLI